MLILSPSQPGMAVNLEQVSIPKQIPKPVSTQQPELSRTATPLDENVTSEGNHNINTDVPRFQNLFQTQTEEGTSRGSSRSSKLPAKLNEF